MSRPVAAFLAGVIAIILNSLLLSAADLVPLVTAHGGLLRLVKMATALPLPASAAFRWEFHIGVGLAMAMVYAFILEPAMPGTAFVKGLVYALVVWVLNSAVVLPLIGEGFAGSRNLALPGMIWFAAAHTAFFVCLAVLYARFRGSEPSVSHRIGGRSRTH